MAHRFESYADLPAEAALDTRRLVGALEPLAAAQAAGSEKALWQLRTVPASEGDADSLPGFTPRSSTPLNDPLDDAGRGGAAQPASDRHGVGLAGTQQRDSAWRHYGAHRRRPALSALLWLVAQLFGNLGTGSRRALSDASRLSSLAPLHRRLGVQRHCRVRRQ